MAWFGSSRKLGVVLTADTRQLERGLDRANAKLASFGKGARVGKGGLGAAIFSGKGLGMAAGASTALYGLKNMIDAAKDAQVVLGQTEVALRDAGLSWERYGAKVQKASDLISDSSAFDDEDVLRSFQVFVRGQKDVEKSLKLTELAADVARGRYTDLASATQLVNKAAMGQVGALRRAGIQIDKNATAAQALDALQKAYSGSAKTYADSATGASERLQVAWENLAETAGGPLLNSLADVTEGLVDFTNAAKDAKSWADKLAKVELPGGSTVGGWASAAWNQVSPFTWKQVLPGPLGPAARIIDLLTGGGDSSSKTFPSGPGGPGGLIPRWGSPLNNLPNKVIPAGPTMTREQKLLLARQRAGNTKYLSDDLKAAHALVDFYRGKVGGAKTAKDLYAAQQSLISAQGDYQSIQDQIADNAKDATKSAKKTESATKKMAMSAEQFANAWQNATEGLKSARLERFDLFRDARQVSRDLVDAKANLRKNLMIGGSQGILEARRDVEDAQTAKARLAMQGVTYQDYTSRGPGGRMTSGITIHINGADDPVLTAKKVIAELRKKNRRIAPQTSGRRPGEGIF